MKRGKALRRALATLPTTPFTGVGSRSVHVRYLDTLLGSRGSERESGRFHVRGTLRAVYFSLDPLTALLEVGAALRVRTRLVTAPHDPHVMLSAEITLHRVLDLTEEEHHGALGTHHQELTGNWRRATREAPAPTQRLGGAAAELGIQGLVYTSAKNDLGTNIVVYPDTLPPGRVVLIDDSETIRATLPEGGERG